MVMVMVMVCGYWPWLSLSATMIPTRHRRPLTPGQGWPAARNPRGRNQCGRAQSF
jgi:hypothetical protein